MINFTELIRKSHWTYCFVLLLFSTCLQAQTHLVKDISTAPSGITDGLSNPIEIVEANGVVFFTAASKTLGTELWKTNGTAEGTMLVKDIIAGAEGSNPSNLVAVNGVLYFSANDGINGNELWRSDGTAEGTVMVKDIYPGGWASPSNLINAGTFLLFSASDGVNGNELWRTDGTAAGTSMVKDIAPGANYSFPMNLLNINGTIYFTARDGANGNELWKTDGTLAGTVLVKDIRSGFYSSDPDNLTNINGVLFFVADDGTTGRELWKSDGTGAGTTMVKDIVAGATGSSLAYLTNVNGTLFFSAYTAATGSELWKSDGTAAGTVMVKDIAPGTMSGLWVLDHMTALGNTIFFAGFTNETGIELWKSDGTAAGTVLVKEFRAGSDHGVPKYMTVFNNELFFTANSTTEGSELWKTNGTEAGTVLFKDIIPGAGGSLPQQLVNLNGRLYFTADDGVHGNELWKTDGTPASTVMVKDAATGTSGSQIGYNTSELNGNLIFNATDDFPKPWKTDGSETGTSALVDDRGVQYQIALNGIIFFTAYDNSGKFRLWKIDAAGNKVTLGPVFSSANQLTAIGSTIYFQANDIINGAELWKTDGTDAGTVMIKDIRTGTGGSNPRGFINLNGVLFFQADNGTNGTELWKCDDGTAAGTIMVKDIQAGANGSNPDWFLNMNGTLYFAAEDGVNGRELWKSDGTAAGTTMVKDVAPGSEYSSPALWAVFNNKFYFSAYDPTHGVELWKSDGTAAGTEILKDINEGSPHSFPTDMVVVNGVFYFLAQEDTHGKELWKSDGTAEGTVLVKDITPGTISTDILNPMSYDNKLFFVAGSRLWKSEGGECNTVPLTNTADVNVTDWMEFRVINNKLFFVGITEATGDELFYYDFSNVNTPGCTQTVTFNALDSKIYGDAAFDLSASASSGLAVTYVSSNTNVATINGTKVTIVGAGEATITALQVGDKNYAAASAQQKLVVNKASQSITFAALDVKAYGDSFILGASATSGLAIVFSSSNTNVATINGNKVTIVGVGTCTITATQSGDNNYEAATAVERTLTAKSADLKLVYNGAVVSPLTLAYDKVLKNTASTLKFTIKNNGDLNLSITSMNYPTGYSVDKSTATLAPGESTEIKVTFAPTAVQEYNGVLEIISNVNIGALAGKTTVTLTGKGVLITGVEGNGAFGSELATVFPNPGKDVFRIKMLSDEAADVVFQMVSSTGEQIAANFTFEGDKTYAVDLSGKATGLYYLFVQSKGERSVFKLLKY